MRNIVCCWDLKEPFVEFCVFDCSQFFNKSFVEKPCGWFNTRKKELLSILMMNHNILNATSAVYRLFVRICLCNSKTLLIIFWIFTGHMWRKRQKKLEIFKQLLKWFWALSINFRNTSKFSKLIGQKRRTIFTHMFRSGLPSLLTTFNTWFLNNCSGVMTAS